MNLDRRELITGLMVFITMVLSGCHESGDKTEIYALMGQSNMAGRGEVDSTVNAQASSEILMFTREDTIDVARHPIHFDKPVAGVGPGLAFGSTIHEKQKCKVLLVPCAVGGTSINVWKPGMHDKKTNTHPYDDAIRRLELAMKFGELKGVIWHQGESDRRKADYLPDLIALIQRLRDFAGNPDLPFIVGELGYFVNDSQTFNRNLHQLPALLENVAVVSAKGLTHKGDELHFDSKSAEILGKRYADAMLEFR